MRDDIYPYAIPDNFNTAHYPNTTNLNPHPTENHEEAERAIKAHKSVAKELKDSPVVLAATHSSFNQLCHSVRYPDKDIPAMLEYATQLKNVGRNITAELNGQEPEVFESEDDLYRQPLLSCMIYRHYLDDLPISTLANSWRDMRTHDLLQECLKISYIPHRWEEINNRTSSFNAPQPLYETYAKAKKAGYPVPDQFIVPTNHTSYGETEAYHAAIHMGLNKTAFTNNEQDAGIVRDRVLQVSSSFIVPNPNPSLAPYVIDQLWIVEGKDHSVRFLAVEIDGEYHLTEEARAKDEARDVYLNSLGYEVYRLAGWWCRIDPWRAIGEFMSLALNLKGIRTQLGFVPLDIQQYCCYHCRLPMVRWDTDDISWMLLSNYERESLPESEEQLVFMHRKCLDDNID